jgi:hypothetical protein
MRFEPPTITDEDAAWACEALKLPRRAFTGFDGSDPRLEVLRSTEALDVEACPGSGKTTLLVAKLAILARKWTDARRGICVFSHTNVARREIETRLGGTAAGHRLLGYPHFVGTIHGFVNDFLAIPWLRSAEYPIRVIDNHRCELHRRRLLELSRFSALAGYVKGKEASGPQINIVGKWRVGSLTFEVLKDNSEPEFKDETRPAARQLRALAKQCVEDGYHRFEEMFVWGNALLDQCPDIRSAIRWRFPLLFNDEVQDNDEDQSRLLFRVFIEGDQPAIRQRYGDSNQAIYRNHRETAGASTDAFPDPHIRRDIPNSHRFGQGIADLAKPLGVVPQALVGSGPQASAITSDTAGKHAVLLFSDETIRCVIPAYAGYLCELFSERELREGTFTVVASVHRPGPEDKLPRFLGQYWPEYDAEITASEPRPDTLYQYLMAGRRFAEQSGEAHHIVEKLADGILRFVRACAPAADIPVRKRNHRHVLDCLREHHSAMESYLEVLTCLAADRAVPSAEQWNAKWAPSVCLIAKTISGSEIPSHQISEFLRWPGEAQSPQEEQPRERDNLFRYPCSAPKVRLRVGSIHSVKGETHTATLVLDTFYKKFNLDSLRPWLLGQKSGKGKEGSENQSRLKQHYVAMTCPTHLVCLGMREDAFQMAEIDALKARPWRVARVKAEALEWL